MFKSSVLLLLFALIASGLLENSRADERPKSAELLRQLLASESLSEMEMLADSLSEYALGDHEVRDMIEAAEATTSDSCRIVLWHAIRYSRSRLGRDYQLNVLPMADTPLRIEFIQSLRNPASFDVPLLIAIYESDETRAATDEVSLREFFVRFALSSWNETRTTSWHSTKDSQLYHSVGNRRKADADAAQLRIIAYLIVHGHDLDARISAFEFRGHNWFQGLEGENRARLAEQLLATADGPKESARLVSILRRHIPPSRFLRSGQPLEVRLAAVAALGEIVEENWQSTGGYTYLRQTYRELLPIAQDEDQTDLRRAAAAMIQSMENRYGEKAVRQE